MALNVTSEELRQLFDAALDAVVCMRADGTIAAWNKQAEVIFGWRHDQAIGQPLASLIIPPDLRDAHRKGLQRFLATGEGPLINRRIEVRALHKDGREFPAELTILPLEQGDRLRFFAFVRDISAIKEAAAEQATLRELAHRMSNMIAIVSAVFQQSLRHAPSLDGLNEAFTQRLQALAAASRLLTDTEWHSAPLDKLVQAALRPHCPEESHQCEISGPRLQLAASAVPPLSMVLHELGTNATKYGALSVPQGKLHISWSKQTLNSDAVPTLILKWRERDGPAVQPPVRQGYGMSLIRDTIEKAMGGTALMHFNPGGLEIDLQMPLPAPIDEATARAPR
jgi:PAS domain S-box-containing protein